MSKATSVLGLMALAVGVCLVAEEPGSKAPQFQQQQLRHAVGLILRQPRFHRELIQKVGLPLTPLLVKELRAWRGASSVYSDLYAWLRDKSPVALQRVLPEPISDELRCLNSIRALAYLGRPASGATRTLIPFLRDARFAPDAAHALASIGPGAKQAMPALIAALDDQVPYAATALGNIGLDAIGAVPALDNARSDAVVEGPGWFRREVERALERIHATQHGVEVCFHDS